MMPDDRFEPRTPRWGAAAIVLVAISVTLWALTWAAVVTFLQIWR
jgi:hypothetical protein